jgi:hypothetical protein
MGRRAHVDCQTRLAAADAIVVLSGSATYIERTSWAAKLFREKKAPLVIVTDEKLLSGWSQTEQRNPFFYELAVRELQRQGVPPANIQVVSDIGRGTFQECERGSRFRRRAWASPIVVSNVGLSHSPGAWSIESVTPQTGLQNRHRRAAAWMAHAGASHVVDVALGLEDGGRRIRETCLLPSQILKPMAVLLAQEEIETARRLPSWAGHCGQALVICSERQRPHLFAQIRRHKAL